MTPATFLRPRLTRITLPLVVALATLPALSRADEADDGAPDFDALIAELGAVDFADREQAEQQLLKLGVQAAEPLRVHLEGQDAEVSRRIRRVLRDILVTDLKLRIEAFRKDAASEGENVPQWTRFKTRVGSSEAERAVFLKMLDAEPGLLMSCERGADAAQAALRLRIRQYMQGQNYSVYGQRTLPGAGSLLAMLFVSGDAELTGNAAPMEVAWLRSWLRQTPFKNFIEDKKNGTAGRQLLVQWVLARTNNGTFHIERLQEAVTYKLKEAVAVAVQGLKTKPHVGLSIESIGRLGGKEYAALLVPVLEDSSVVATFAMANRKTTEIQARDVALAWLASLTGQDPKTYGMKDAENWFKSLKRSNSASFNSRAYAVDDPKKRAEYRKAWDEWVKKNPLPEPPEDYSEIIALGPAKVATNKKEEPDDEEEWEEPEPFSGPQLAERSELKLLRDAQAAVADGNWDRAAQAIAQLADIPQEKWFQPVRGVPNYRELRSEVERLILSMPDAGRARVEQFSGALARGRLDKALAESDVEAIREISQSYFFTKAGAEATWRIAAIALDSGHAFDAMLQLERLVVASPYAGRFEPQLSLRRALCLARLGRIEQAARVVEELRVTHPDISQAPGFTSMPQAADEAKWAEWLASVSEYSGITVPGWLMHRGDASRNSISSTVIPWLEGGPVATVTEQDSLKPAVEALIREVRDMGLGRIPSMQPITTDHHIVFRTATGIRAVDHDGKLLWSSPQQDTLWRLCRDNTAFQITDTKNSNGTTNANPEQQIGHAVLHGLRGRLLDNTVYGTLSSDGQRVFAVENDSFQCPPTVQRLSLTGAGELKLETRIGNRRSSLAAYDLTTGRLQWRHPHNYSADAPASDADQESVEVLGAPLVAGASLFVVVRTDEEVLLQQLDPESGDVNREWMLQTDTPPPTYAAWQAQFPQTSGHRHACSPSLVDGTIVCLTPSQRVVAIDLRTGRLQWSWVGSKKKKADPRMRFNPWAQFAAKAQRDGQLHHWCDTSLILDSQTVLVAPPDSDRLTCLNLSDGSVRWSARRLDGLYVAGMQEGRVIVIGRAGARAHDLQTGELTWPTGSVAWPDAAMPSGTGYIDRDRCCVPLNNGDVVVIDIPTGQWIARSRPRESATPENLVAAGDTVWSLGLTGLHRYSSASLRAEELAERRTDDSDAGLLADLGESLLNSGHIVEALAPLKAAAQSNQKERAEELLARAISDGVPFDTDLRSQLVRDLNLTEQSTQNTANLLARTAVGFERQGDLTRAIEVLMQIADLPIIRGELDREKALTYSESVSRSIRIDHWFQSKFERWYPAAPEAVRERIDQKVAELTADDPDRAALWFGRHATGSDILLKMAEQYDDDRVRWELTLRQIQDRGAPQSEAAIERLLSGLATDTEHRSVFANRHRNGKQELTVAARSPWPQDSVQKKIEKRDPKSKYLQRMLIPIERHDRQLDEPLWLRLNLSERKWDVLDAIGRVRYELDKEKDEKNKTTSYSYSASVAHAKVVGPLLVIWTGMQITAFHLHDDQGTRLWSKTVYDSRNRHWTMRYAQRRMQRAGRRAAVVFGIAGPSTWQAFEATPDYVAVQIDRSLFALDPATGSVLWKHDGLPLDCDITGTQHAVLVIPPDQDEVIVLNALDGGELDRHTVPEDSSWVSLYAGRLMSLQTSQQQQQSVLQCLDLETGEAEWSHTFAADSVIDTVHPDVIAVLEPNGQFAAIDAKTGKVRTSARLDGFEKMQELTVFESRGRYIVCARSAAAAQPNGQIMRVHMSGATRGRMKIGGKVAAIDSADAYVEWYAELPRETVAPVILSDVPLAASFYSIQKQSKLPNGQLRTTTEAWLNVLNLNNGIVAHNEKVTSGSQMDQQFEPNEKRVDYHTRSNILQFRFTVE